jgi:hypothetical protein
MHIYPLYDMLKCRVDKVGYTKWDDFRRAAFPYYVSPGINPDLPVQLVYAPIYGVFWHDGFQEWCVAIYQKDSKAGAGGGPFPIRFLLPIID